MLVTMNDKEIFRLGTIRDVCEKRIKRKDAAQLLNVSVRQVQRLITRYRDLGAVGLVHQIVKLPFLIPLLIATLYLCVTITRLNMQFEI